MNVFFFFDIFFLLILILFYCYTRYRCSRNTHHINLSYLFRFFFISFIWFACCLWWSNLFPFLTNTSLLQITSIRNNYQLITDLSIYLKDITNHKRGKVTHQLKSYTSFSLTWCHLTYWLMFSFILLFFYHWFFTLNLYFHFTDFFKFNTWLTDFYLIGFPNNQTNKKKLIYNH